MRRLLVSLVSAAMACAVFAASSEAYVYWANFNQGFGSTISRANLDGSGTNDTFITGARMPVDPVVDGSHIYWGNYDNPGTIGRANLDGTGVEQSFIVGVLGPLGIAVGAHHIYWGNYFGNSIGRANLDGTGVDQSFIVTSGGPYGVTVDAGHVYWSNFDSIGRANLDGSDVNQNFVPANDGVEATVDGAHIYWGDYIAGTIGRANLDGSGVDQNFITGASGPRGLTTDAAHIYWDNFASNTIGRANLDGTAVQQGFISAPGQPWGVAVDQLPVQPPVPPTAQIGFPADNQTFSLGQQVRTTFACAEGARGPGLASCVDSNGASAPSGSLNTANAGAFTYTVTATSQDGLTATSAVHYTVARAATSLIASPVLISGISARLTRVASGAPLAGQTLLFTAGASTLCAAVTDTTGTARCTSLTALLSALLNLGYNVTFAGTNNYLGASAHGSAIALVSQLTGIGASVRTAAVRDTRTRLEDRLRAKGARQILAELRALRDQGRRSLAR